MEVFRGNSIPITINATYKDGSQYIFKSGDTVILGIKKYVGCPECDYTERQVATDAVSNITFNISPEHTCNLEGEYVLEATLIYNNGVDVSTLFQEELIVKGVVNNE